MTVKSSDFVACQFDAKSQRDDDDLQNQRVTDRDIRG